MSNNQSNYCKMGEEHTAYECTNDECQWQGADKDKITIKIKGWDTLCCPECKNEVFYGIKHLTSKV